MLLEQGVSVDHAVCSGIPTGNFWRNEQAFLRCPYYRVFDRVLCKRFCTQRLRTFLRNRIFIFSRMKEKSSPFKSSSMKSSMNPSTTKLSSSTSSQRKMNGFSTTEDDSRDSGHGQICCLVDDSQRCTRPAGNACYSKRIAKTVQQRKLKLTIDHSVRHIYICDFHKSMIQSVRSTKKRKKGSDEDGGISPDHDLDVPEVDLFHLQVNTLRRYKRHYKIQTKPGLNKAQLADMVARHFRTIPVREKEALTYFIYMVKNNKSRFDQKHDHS